MGLVEVNITFPPEFFGLPVGVDTLALVAPHIKPSQQFILIGTSTLDVAYRKHFDTHPDQSFQPILSGYITVYKILQHCYIQSLDDHTATVTLQSNQSQIITAGQTKGLEECLTERLWQDEKQVLLEHRSSYDLSGGPMKKICTFQTVISQEQKVQNSTLSTESLHPEVICTLARSCLTDKIKH